MVGGTVTKVMSSWYEVLTEGRLVVCRPRGRFKIESQEVLAGDRVSIRLLSDGTGYIEKVSQRSNSLIRPPVANVDRAVVVFTFRDPPINALLVDRMTVYASVIKCGVTLVLNKTDLVSSDQVEEVRRLYEPAGYDFFAVSALSGQGVAALRKSLSGAVSVLAGQSGVGKSRLLNALSPGAGRKTGEVSERIRRGRHTTRHVELIDMEDGGIIADTPGFSLLEPPSVGKWELSSFLPEIRGVEASCRFSDCLHRGEPDCAVKQAVSEGKIPASRYESYLTILAEIEEMEGHKY